MRGRERCGGGEHETGSLIPMGLYLWVISEDVWVAKDWKVGLGPEWHQGTFYFTSEALACQGSHEVSVYAHLSRVIMH